MLRIRTRCSVLSLPQCPLRMLIKRDFSFLIKTGGSEDHAAQSRLFYASGKQTEIQHKRFFNTNERLLTTNAPKGEMVLDNESDMGNGEKTINRINDQNCQTNQDLAIMKNVIGRSVLKEENLNLFWKLSQGDPELFNELRTWQMRINILLSFFGAANCMSDEKWAEFLKIGKGQKERYFNFLIGTAVKKQNITKEKYKLPQQHEDFEDHADNYDDPMCYHLFHNSMFLNVRSTALRKLLYARGMVSVVHGPEIFIDCSYEEYMNRTDCKYLARQIIDGVKKNLTNDQPFHLILCNFNKDGLTGKYLSKNSPLLLKDCHPVTHTLKSYLDFYPREKLVYLSPHCQSVMTQFEPDKRYIIGGFVDKSVQQPISLAKAKENKIEMKKLPIDLYLDWKFGKKTLCINHVLAVLLSLKRNNNWTEAFEYLPRRFVTLSPGEKRKLYKSSKIKLMTKHILALGTLNSPKGNHQQFNKHI